jgi:hypothetical protein
MSASYRHSVLSILYQQVLSQPDCDHIVQSYSKPQAKVTLDKVTHGVVWFGVVGNALGLNRVLIEF